MKAISNILGRFGYTKRSTTSNPAQWFIDWVHGGEPTASGKNVNEQSALKYTPFWASVRVITGAIASLPFIVYRRNTSGGKNRVMTHRTYGLLHDRPNEYMDALTFIETRQAHALTYGNGYAEIQRDGAGRPIALWPLLPDKTFRRISDEGLSYYEIQLTKGGSVYLPDYNVLHIKGLGFDGYTGYNVVSYHKEAIGYGMAVKEYGARFFSNNASPGGVLEHPKILTDPARKNIKESWEAAHKGLSQAHRMQIFEEGMKWVQTGVDPEHAQALEVQKYTVDDCSRIFNIPPHKIGSLERATFSNIEEQNIDFVTLTMFYWFRKWEQECNYKLFSPAERKSMFCEILVDGLLRGKTLSRYQAYNIGRNAGFLSVNDIREKENMNTIGQEGDVYLEPMNMQPAGTEPSPAEPKKIEGDNIRNAHRALIISQLSRVITKRNKGDSFETSRTFAKKILYEPACAFASTLNRNIEVRGRLDNIIDELINENIKLIEKDVGELADTIIERIGGNHATT